MQSKILLQNFHSIQTKESLKKEIIILQRKDLEMIQTTHQKQYEGNLIKRKINHEIDRSHKKNNNLIMIIFQTLLPQT